MSTAAARMRRMRERRARERQGFEEFTALTKRDRLVLALIEDGFLKEWDEHDGPAIHRAFEAMVEAYVVSMLGSERECDAVTGNVEAVCLIGSHSLNANKD